MKTTNEVFKEVLVELGFDKCKPSEMSNSDYWLCTTTAMERYAELVKNCSTTAVSKQREILLDFISDLDDDKWFNIKLGYKENLVDEYLKSNNCE